MGKILPIKWLYVRMSVVDRTDNTITIKLERLQVGVENACSSGNDTKDRSNP